MSSYAPPCSSIASQRSSCISSQKPERSLSPDCVHNQVAELIISPSLSHQLKHQHRIDSSAAACHHDPLHRCVAHRGVNSASTFHRRQRGTGPEVSTDQAKALARVPLLLPLGRDHLSNVLMVDAMKSGASEALVSQLCRQGIRACCEGQCLVESHVKTGPLRPVGNPESCPAQCSLCKADGLCRGASGTSFCSEVSRSVVIRVASVK